MTAPEPSTNQFATGGIIRPEDAANPERPPSWLTGCGYPVGSVRPVEIHWIHCEHDRRLIDCPEPWHDPGVGPVRDVPRGIDSTRALDVPRVCPCRRCSPPVPSEGWSDR